MVVLLSTEGALSGGWAGTVAVDLVESWGRAGARVVVADAGLSTPLLHDALGIPNHEGLVDALRWGVSVQRVIHRPEGRRFLALTAGTAVADTASVLSLPRWHALCSGFREAGVTMAVLVPCWEEAVAAVLQEADGIVILADPSEDLQDLVAGLTAPVLAVTGRTPSAGTEVGRDTPPSHAEEATPGSEPQLPLEGAAPAAATGGDGSDDTPFEISVGAPGDAHVQDDSSAEAPEAAPAEDEEPAEAPEAAPVADKEPAEEPDFTLVGEGASTVGSGFALVGDDEASDDASDFTLGDDEASDEPSGFALVDDETLATSVGSTDASDDGTPRFAAPASESPDVAPPSVADEEMAEEHAQVFAARFFPEAPATPEGDDDFPLPDPIPVLPSLDAILEESEPPRQGRSQLGVLMLLLLIVAVWAASWFGYVEIPGLPTRPTEEPAVPAGGATVATMVFASDASVVQGYSLGLGSYQDGAVAAQSVARLREQVPGVLFQSVPVQLDGALFFRVLAGPVADSAAVSALATHIAQAASLDPTPWVARWTPFAFRLDEMPDLGGAEQRVEALDSLGIPAYVLAVDNDDGSTVYRVYAGAFGDATEASYLSGLLDERGLSSATLSDRTGRLPE